MRPWVRDERGTTNKRESSMEWRCGRPVAPRGAARMLATRSPPGRWQRWWQATENDGVAHRREPSEQHGGEGSPTLSSSTASVCHGDGGATERLIDGREATAHPYLARQMSDVGFRQTLKVRTLGCARSLSLLPIYAPAR